jgi:hypothetical protein
MKGAFYLFLILCHAVTNKMPHYHGGWEMRDTTCSLMLVFILFINLVVSVCVGSIHEAVINDDFEQIEQLIEQAGKGQHASEQIHVREASVAASVNQVESFNVVAARALVNKPDENGYMPLHLVESLKVAELLVKHGANVNAYHCHKDNRYSPLYYAAEKGDANLVKFFVGQGAKIPSSTSDGVDFTLHTAAESGDVATVRYLVEKCNFNILMKDSQDKIPLWRACERLQYYKDNRSQYSSDEYYDIKKNQKEVIWYLKNKTPSEFRPESIKILSRDKNTKWVKPLILISVVGIAAIILMYWLRKRLLRKKKKLSRYRYNYFLQKVRDLYQQYRDNKITEDEFQECCNELLHDVPDEQIESIMKTVEISFELIKS